MTAELELSEEFYDILLAGNALLKQGWRSEPIANPIADVVLQTVGGRYRRRDHLNPRVQGVIDCITVQLLHARGPWPFRRHLFFGLFNHKDAKEVAHSLVHSVVRHGSGGGGGDGTNLWEVVRVDVLVGLGVLLHCQRQAHYELLAPFRRRLSGAESDSLAASATSQPTHSS